MNKVIYYLFMSLGLLTFPSSSFALELTVGQSRRLPVNENTPVQIGSQKILKAIDHGSFITLIARKEGRTLVTLGEKSISVLVRSPNEAAFKKDLRRFLENAMGLQLSEESSPLAITGNIYVFKDWLQISNLARRWQATYRFLAHPTKEVQEEAGKYFLRRVRELNLGSFRLGREMPLKALVSTKKADFKKAEDLFLPFGIEVEKASGLMEVRPLIKTSVILAEVSKQISESFGLQFPAQAEGQLLPSVKGPSSLLVSLKALESKGLGKVLASPTLTCRSGAQAEFHAGGELPIKLGGYLKQGVEWKKHGVLLKVKPKADSLGNIQLSIETEISLVDTSRISDGLPAFKVNRVSSEFDLKGKKTIALSGLIQETWGKSRSGLSGLSSLPFLGALFGSRDFLNNKSEMVVFVTPEIVSADQPGDIQWPQGWSQNDW